MRAYKESGMSNECVEWLAEFLGGQVFRSCERVRAEAARQGFSRGDLSKARKTLGVTTINDSSIYGEPRNWFWLIPKEENTDA